MICWEDNFFCNRLHQYYSASLCRAWAEMTRSLTCTGDKVIAAQHPEALEDAIKSLSWGFVFSIVIVYGTAILQIKKNEV